MNRLKTLLLSPLSLRAHLEESALARAPHHELAICAIFREEAPFFEEWLSFHRGIGVTHFYLYNNFSTDEFFGGAGHETRPPGSLLDAFTRRAPWEFALSGKTIANPRMIYAIRSPHVFKYWHGEAVDTLRRPLSKGQSPPVFDRLRFNHYWSRSLADLRTKVGRGDASTWHERDLAWHLAFEAQMNQEEDRAILPIAARTRTLS